MEQNLPTAPWFFGYGSLVNLRTHSYPNARPARLQGWRRVWRHTNLRPRPFLTIELCRSVSIDGVIATVPNADWAALDQREAVYDRHLLDEPPLITNDALNVDTVSTYVIPVDKYPIPAEEHPILLSYLDVCAQGYWNLFGKKGAVAFFETTVGWPSLVQDDRAAPIYPRAQKLTPPQRDLVDDQLRQLGCVMRS